MTRRVKLADLPLEERRLVGALVALQRAIDSTPTPAQHPTSTAAVGGGARPASGSTTAPRPAR